MQNKKLSLCLLMVGISLFAVGCSGYETNDTDKAASIIAQEDGEAEVCESCADIKAQIKRVENVMKNSKSIIARKNARENLQSFWTIYEECTQSHCPDIKICERCALYDQRIADLDRIVRHDYDDTAVRFAKREKERLQKISDNCKQNYCSEEAKEEIEEVIEEREEIIEEENEIIEDAEEQPLRPVAEEVKEVEKKLCHTCSDFLRQVRILEDVKKSASDEQSINELNVKIDRMQARYDECIKDRCNSVPRADKQGVCSECSKKYEEMERLEKAYDRAFLRTDRQKLQDELKKVNKDLENCKIDHCE